jgi:hypothetical protein
MQIQINTDSSVRGDTRTEEVAREAVLAALGPLAARLTRVEVHLSDENARKGGADDIRCMIEARPEGMGPLAVTHNDADIVAALRGAGRKLRALLDSEFGRRDARR